MNDVQPRIARAASTAGRRPRRGGRRRYIRALLSTATVIGALVLTVATSPAASADRSATHTASTESCGGEVVAGMTCSFDDEFSGNTLDTSKWTAWNGVNYFDEPDVCYYTDPDNVAVSGGYLDLSVTKLATPQTCSTPYGTRTVTYGAGVAYTQGHFSQTYGRYSARIKFAGGVGLHDAFWMTPEANDYPGHAEIDVAESWGALPDTVYASTHITGPNNEYVSRTGTCDVDKWSTAFHTYSVQWTSTSLTFSYDGTPCYTYSGWTPVAGQPASAPFNQPFYLILQDLVDNGTYSPAPDSTTIFPATTQVDWVRAWAPTSSTPPAQSNDCSTAPFPDVATNNPFCGDIAWLADRKITQGNADGTFAPNAPISRQAMAAFLYRYDNPDQSATPCTVAPFPDVATNNPFCGDITWLADRKITQGNADGTFAPNAPISRQAMAAFLHRYDNPDQSATPCTVAPFPDVATNNPFCGDITWLADHKITQGNADGTFAPNAPISRQAMAAFLHRYANETPSG